MANRVAKQYDNEIKERLNLHVKKRLQQEQQQQQPQLQQQQQYLDTHNNSAAVVAAAAAAAAAAAVNQPKKSRKPYQKRAAPNNNNNINGLLQQTAGESLGNRKKTPACKRQKLKKFGNTGDESLTDDLHASTAVNGTHSSAHHTSLTVLTGDDDVSLDGPNDISMRSPHSRDKEKYPDILGLVLNSKKRSIMQDPEVQQFFTQIFEAFRK